MLEGKTDAFPAAKLLRTFYPNLDSKHRFSVMIPNNKA